MTASRPLEPAARAQSDDLLERLAALDDAAWQAVYEEHYLRVRNFAYARLGDVAEAEDVASEVFAAAVRGIARYQDRGAPLAAWLFRIARNRVADYLRRRRPAGRSEQAEPPAPGGELQQVEDREQLMRGLRRLTEEQQTVIGLRFFSDCSIEDTARAMGKSQAAVKVLQQRALASLRRHLVPKGGAR